MKKALVLITGDREWDDEKAIRWAFRWCQPTRIIEGEARGADRQCRKVAEQMGILVTKMPAQWNEYGRAAGPIRNRAMLDLKPDLVLAFHNDLEHSKGTRDCVREALRRGLLVYLVQHRNRRFSAKRVHPSPPIVHRWSRTSGWQCKPALKLRRLTIPR